MKFLNLKENINNPVWIITCARSGSDYLSRMLDKIVIGNNLDKKFGFKEHYNFASCNYSYYSKQIFYDLYKKVNFNNNDYYGQYIKILEEESKKYNFLKKYNKIIIDKKLYPKYNKVLSDQISKWKKSDFIDVKNSLPRLKCIHLIRKDIYNQTVSLYFAEKTHKFHFRSNDNDYIKIYLKKEIEFNEKHILRVYNNLLYYKQQCYYQIEGLDCPCHIVYYEDLCENLNIELCRICEFLSIDKSKISLIHSKEFQNNSVKIVTHPLKHEYVEKLKELIEIKKSNFIKL